MRSIGKVQGFWREGIVVELVKVAFIGELFLRPDSAEAFDKLSAATGHGVSGGKDTRGTNR